jgi:hypothetical protein
MPLTLPCFSVSTSPTLAIAVFLLQSQPHNEMIALFDRNLRSPMAEPLANSGSKNMKVKDFIFTVV